MKIETLVNFREIGGVKTKDGLTVQSGRILRSGEFLNLSEQDKNTLKSDYQLKMIYDLRDRKEVSKKPDDVLDGVGYTHIDIMRELLDSSASQDGLKEQMRSSNPDEQMINIYKNLIINKVACNGYHEFIESLSHYKEGAIIFHCFAGKDRTGVGAAIILELLGVSRDDIMEDYLKTNAQRKEVNEQIVKESREKGIPEAELEALRTLMSVKAEYLEAAYKTMEEHFGSVENYFKDGLELDAETIKRLRENYLIRQ